MIKNVFLAAVAACVLIAGGLSPEPAAAQSKPAKRAITKIAGDLYRFQNNFHFSVFLVTSAGVIATDPINADAAAWLEKEIRTRFGKEIRYVIYSHDHADHISGGEVWADTAIVVAHEQTRRTIVGEKRPTAVPNVTFKDHIAIRLGGKRVNLRYFGKSHSDNMIVMHFPSERAVFTVDFISVKRVGFRTLSDAYFPDWMQAIRQVELIDFDILVPGHGPMGTKADATDHREFLQDLYDAVLKAARAGQSLEQMKASIMLPKYKAWGQYKNWFPLNIEGMYNQIKMHRRGN